MSNKSVYDLNHFLDKGDIFLSYSGQITQNIIVEFSEKLQKKLDLESPNIPFTKKIFAIFVELLQNMLHYSAKEMILENSTKKIPEGIVTITKDDNYIYIISGNLIYNEQKDDLKRRIELVNNLSADELKKLYKETLKNPPDPNRKGAGIGIIDISRKSQHQLKYEFRKIDKNTYFFSVRAQILYKKKGVIK